MIGVRKAENTDKYCLFLSIIVTNSPSWRGHNYSRTRGTAVDLPFCKNADIPAGTGTFLRRAVDDRLVEEAQIILVVIWIQFLGGFHAVTFLSIVQLHRAFFSCAGWSSEAAMRERSQVKICLSRENEFAEQATNSRPMLEAVAGKSHGAVKSV